MKKETKEFVRMLHMSQEELYDYVLEAIPENMTIINVVGSYIYISTTPNQNKPLLISHLDTVDSHGIRGDKQPIPNIVIDNSGIMSVADDKSVLGADDRAGVWIMLQMLRKDIMIANDYDYLFCCDEEIGGVGSSVFAKDYKHNLNNYNCFISLDRQGTDEVATYGYDNDDLIKVFKDVGYVKARGTFTDCVNLSSESDIACVNLSVGYFNEHSSREIQHIDVLYSTLEILTNNDIRDKLAIVKYEAKKDNYWYSYDSNYDLDPCLCDCCGQHLPLYNIDISKTEYVMVCEECVPLYEYLV